MCIRYERILYEKPNRFHRQNTHKNFSSSGFSLLNIALNIQNTQSKKMCILFKKTFNINLYPITTQRPLALVNYLKEKRPTDDKEKKAYYILFLRYSPLMN